jgi:hypothetical protein
LLVTDLVELSRNGAICDALLLGGDEDLRIGVQIAQSFGVRVHLIGIEPSRGSQSLQLRQEADTKHEISAAEIAKFLQVIPTFTPPPVLSLPTLHKVELTPIPATSTELELQLNDGIQSVLQKLDKEDIAGIAETIERMRSVPAIHDRRVLASCRTSLGRDLTMEEKKTMRVLFTAAVQARLQKD